MFPSLSLSLSLSLIHTHSHTLTPLPFVQLVNFFNFRTGEIVKEGPERRGESSAVERRKRGRTRTTEERNEKK